MFAVLTRLLQEWARPGDQAHEAAKKGMAAYHALKDADILDKAIRDFQQAVDAKSREGNNAELALALVDYSMALWERFQRHTKAPEDLDEMIACAEEALYMTSKIFGSQHTLSVGITYALARAYAGRYTAFKVYDAETRQSSYKVAIEYFDLAKTFRWNWELEMGVLMRIRCSLEKTSDSIDDSIHHLEAGLQTVRDYDEATSGTLTNDDERRKHRLAMDHALVLAWYNLAYAHELRYELVNQDVRDLDVAISYSTKTKTFLEKRIVWRADIAGCLYKLAGQLFLRWKATHDENDLQQAKEAIEGAREAESENPHDPLDNARKSLTDFAGEGMGKHLDKERIDELFTVIQAAAQ